MQAPKQVSVQNEFKTNLNELYKEKAPEIRSYPIFGAFAICTKQKL